MVGGDVHTIGLGRTYYGVGGGLKNEGLLPLFYYEKYSPYRLYGYR